jgi:hypothetical protein
LPDFGCVHFEERNEKYIIQIEVEKVDKGHSIHYSDFEDLLNKHGYKLSKKEVLLKSINPEEAT